MPEPPIPWQGVTVGVRTLLVLLVLAGGCRERASSASQPAPLASVAAFPEPAAPPPPLVSAPEPALRPSVKLIRAPRLTEPQGIATTPLFECAHVKFAWGREFRGFVLDETGRVWLYDRGGRGWTPERFSEPDPTSQSVDSRWLRRAPLAAHVAPALSTARIELAGLREQSDLIAQAQSGELPALKPEEVPLDFGDGEYCKAYRWNEARSAYQVVDLQRNSSPAAERLSHWLQDIERALLQSPFNQIASELARRAAAANEELRRKAMHEPSSPVVKAPSPKELAASPSPSMSPWHAQPGF